MKNLKWFTLVELVIVIVIMVTLSTIGFVQYSSSLIDSRNAARISDMWNLKISLKNYKLKSWTYPNPWKFFDIKNSSGTWLIKQWKFDENVYITDMTNIPMDPQSKSPYLYWVKSNNLFMQLAISIEDTDQTNQNWYKAMVDWDFQQISEDYPWLIYAQTTTSVLDPKNLIVNNWTLNIPYWEDWVFIQTATSYSQLKSQSWVTIPKFYWYKTCQEILDSWNSFWSWVYNVVSDTWAINGINCTN